MIDRIDQSIKGDGNSQIIVNGNYVAGLDKSEVEALIRTFGYINKNDVIEIVKEVIESIPEDKRIRPNKRIFVPLIQHLSYSMEEECIKELYKKLLKSTMNSENANKIHPAFLNILSQLSSDEIKILNEFTLDAKHNEPLISMRMKNNREEGLGITLVKYFSDIGYGKCENPNNICKYLENLERLKIIEIPFGLKFTDDINYDKLINHSSLKSVRDEIQSKYGVNIIFDYDKMIFRLTNFGIDFITCCK